MGWSLEDGYIQNTSVGTMHGLSKEVLLQGPITFVVVQQRDVLSISHYFSRPEWGLPYKLRKHQACHISSIPGKVGMR